MKGLGEVTYEGRHNYPPVWANLISDNSETHNTNSCNVTFAFCNMLRNERTALSL